MFLVGLTGGIATGKSTVSDILRSCGVQAIIDADAIARKIVEPGSKCWRKVKNSFGDEVITETGDIDRSKLAGIIFDNVEKRKLINSIMHPEIYREIRNEVIYYFLKGKSEEEQQIYRLMKRNGYSKEDALKRISSQMPLEAKCARANFIINNSATIKDTKTEVEGVYKVLRSSRHHIQIRVYAGFILIFITSFLILIIWLFFTKVVNF